jgi:hypothetical protein
MLIKKEECIMLNIAILNSFPFYKVSTLSVLFPAYNEQDQPLYSSLVTNLKEPVLKEVHLNMDPDILNYPDSKYDVVVFKHKLQYIDKYKSVFTKLLDITDKRLIVTVPWRYEGGVDRETVKHAWDPTYPTFDAVDLFKKLAAPYTTFINKVKLDGTYKFLIVVDKNLEEK